MALNRNSTVYVTGFVAIVSIVCAFIVALAATVLKPIQEQQIQSNVQKFVLKVSDIDYTPATLESKFKENIRVAYVDRTTGKLIDLDKSITSYDDILVLNKYEKFTTKIEGSQNIAGLKDNRISNILRIYLVEQNNKVTKIVLPFYGNGLWSVMYGFLAVDAEDANTIKGITYYQQGETPGLGGEVENPRFTENFVGKQIYNINAPTKPEITLVKSISQDPAVSIHQVNALTGATLTSNGVNNQLVFWFGDYGFAKFLANVRNGEVQLNGR